MRLFRWCEKKCANREGAGGRVTPFSSAETVVPVTSGKHDDKPAVVAESFDHKLKCVGFDWVSSSSDAGEYHGSSSSHQRLLTPWISSSSPPQLQTAELQRQHQSACRQVSSRPAPDADRSFAGFRPVDCSLPLHVDDAFSTYRDDDSDSTDAWLAQPSCPASRRETLLAHRYPERAPPTRRPVVPSLRLYLRNRRPSDRLQLFLESPTHTGFGPVSDGKSPQRPVACDLCAGRLVVLR